MVATVQIRNRPRCGKDLQGRAPGFLESVVTSEICRHCITAYPNILCFLVHVYRGYAFDDADMSTAYSGSDMLVLHESSGFLSPSFSLFFGHAYTRWYQ